MPNQITAIDITERIQFDIFVVFSIPKSESFFKYCILDEKRKATYLLQNRLEIIFLSSKNFERGNQGYGKFYSQI